MFLGLYNVYRCFVSGYSKIRALINTLLRADSPDVLPDFTVDHESTFRKLIESVTSPPVIALPNNVLPYSFYKYTSASQVGAELFHTDDETN